jgi:hypothetical protein
MTVHYAVTFEFEQSPPLTHRGTVTAFKVSTCARLALNAAQQALRPVRWTSLNFVVLERVPTQADQESSTAEDSQEDADV